jgi:hypothetical protein
MADKDSGNTSVVYSVRERQSGELFACKVVDKKRFYLEPTMRASLQREVGLLDGLDSPYIVKFIEYHDTDTHVYIITELVTGGDLLAHVSTHGALTEGECRRLFGQVCKAVEYLHARNIIHRDLKPDNILLTGDTLPNVKLADFGVSKSMSDTNLQTFCGTPVYIAPEILLGKQGATYDHKVDIWSLGVILYFMLHAKLPVQGEAFLTNFDCRALLGSSVLSEYGRDLLCNMLVLEPMERFYIHQVRNHAWLNPLPLQVWGRLEPMKGTVIVLEGICVTIGRSHACTVRLDDTCLSSRHIQLWTENGKCMLKVLGKNGCRVNEILLPQEATRQMVDGDVLQLDPHMRTLDYRLTLDKLPSDVVHRAPGAWASLLLMGTTCTRLDLTQDTCVLGRHKDCIGSHAFTHSKISGKRTPPPSLDKYVDVLLKRESGFTSLQNLSPAGTFVNGKHLALNESIVLEHMDQVVLLYSKKRHAHQDTKKVQVGFYFSH